MSGIALLIDVNVKIVNTDIKRQLGVIALVGDMNQWGFFQQIPPGTNSWLNII